MLFLQVQLERGQGERRPGRLVELDPTPALPHGPSTCAAALEPATLACQGCGRTILPSEPRYARPRFSWHVLAGGQGAQPWPHT